MKRVLCAIFALAMVLSFTACGGDSNGGPDPLDYVLDVPETYAESEMAEQGTTLADYSEGIMLPELSNQHVTVMMSIDWAALQQGNNEEEPYAQYHATLMWRSVYEDGDVEIITISDEQQTDFVATQTASGTAPDIIPANYDLTYPRWNAAGLTASVEDYADYLGLYEKNPNNEEEDLYNHELMDKYFQWGGESHGAITLAEVNRNYIVYNKTKFELAGQKTPLEHWQNGNWNWTQFVKTAKAMTSGDDYGFTGWGLFPYFAPYTMAKLDEATGTVELNIDDPKYMRYMTEVYNLYQTENAARRDIALQSWGTLFPMGTDAMVQTTKDGYKRIVEAAKRVDGDTFGIAPVPVFDPAGETESIATATLWAYSIAAAAENPIGAATYIRLETLVSRNVSAALEGKNWYNENLTEDEKAMLEETKDDPIAMEMIRGIGDCYLGIVDASIVPPMYYQENQNSVQSIFDANKAALEAEFEEFNQTVEEIAEELAAEQEEAEAEAEAEAESEDA